MAPHSMSLLPLHRVVLPGSELVLPIFRSPAMAMVDDLAGDTFGGVLIRGAPDRADAELHTVGTELRVIGRKILDDGRLMVRVVGTRRFSISRRLGVDPYPTAYVWFPEEGSAAPLVELRDRLERTFRRYLAVSAECGQGGTVYVEVAGDPAAASYQVASTMRLSSPERQELLEMATSDRLERELGLLSREIDLLERIM